MATAQRFQPQLPAAGPSNDSAFNAQVMSTHEIAELTGKEHKNVLADVRKMLADLEIAAADFSAAATVPGPNNSRRRIDTFNLPKRETLILVSGYSVPMRARIIDRWQQLEVAATPQAAPVPLTRMEILRMALDAEERATAAEGKVAIMQPQVDALHRLADTEGVTLCQRDAAKHMQIKPNMFRDWLLELGWTYRRAENSKLVAFQDAIDRGYLKHKMIERPSSDGATKQEAHVRVTQKGLARLAYYVARGKGPKLLAA